MEKRSSLVGLSADFWLLGGASILVWFAMFVGNIFRDNVGSIQQHFLQVAATFGVLSLVCNYPHFIVSYRFGYGRGWGFISKHWSALILMPAILLGVYIYAYFSFDHDLGELLWSKHFQFGESANLGVELLSGTVWLMFLTVGWHYSKQVFGCMMVYAKFDSYPLTVFQRKVIKSSVYCVAFVNFAFFVTTAYGDSQSYFYNLPLTSLELPKSILYIVEAATALTFLLVLYSVFLKNYVEQKRLPSVNFVIPWLAFYFWWMPMPKHTEYYFYAAPFFHSLQYLPFAYRLEAGGSKLSQRLRLELVMKVFVLLIASYCAFEFLPLLLDQKLETEIYKNQWFFFISFPVFINIHHFFIDSVVWKFHQPEVREKILGLSA